MFIWRVFRRLLAQIIRLLLLNRAVTLGLIAVLIVAFVIYPLMSRAGTLPAGFSQNGVLASDQPAQAASASGSTSGNGAPGAASAQQGLTPDPSVQTFIKGYMTFDANLEWTSLDPQARSQLESQGANLDAWKAQETQKQQAGYVYDKAYYIGGYESKTGLRYFFYIVTSKVKGSDGQMHDTEDALTFTVAPTGGIVDIGLK